MTAICRRAVRGASVPTDRGAIGGRGTTQQMAVERRGRAAARATADGRTVRAQLRRVAAERTAADESVHECTRSAETAEDELDLLSVAAERVAYR